ncbi:MAG: histidine--tRNA ligase [Anaerolineales bacterium]
MSTIQPVKGTRDFFPEEMAFRQWLYGKIRGVSERYGYQEYDAPFLEPLTLYAAKSGEELVEKQSYVFTDRSGDRITLRPELTPSLARMVAQRVRAMPMPIRWWSFGPFWRYEQPQKGRTREFFQWNIDLLGIDSPQADAEIAAIGADFFRSLGLEPGQIQILVNNRRLVERQLVEAGIDRGPQQQVFRLIDRLDKLRQKEWEAYAAEIGLDEEQISGLRAMISNESGWQNSDELVEFFDAGKSMGFGEYVRYDPSIIRGLDYYTGTVFEARDTAGEHRAILGGGRYDNLVADVGGDPVPGVGFAMGDIVIQLVLEQEEEMPELRSSPADLLMTNFDKALETESLELVGRMRGEGFRVEWYPEAGRLGKQFRYADRYGIPFVAILGPEEEKAGSVTIKNMASGDQETMPQDQLSTYLVEALRSSS